MTTFTIKKAQGLPSQEFETITDAIYFLTVHGLKPKKSPLDDDPDWIHTTPKNRLAYLDRKKEDYIAFEDFYYTIMYKVQIHKRVQKFLQFHSELLKPFAEKVKIIQIDPYSKFLDVKQNAVI